MIRTLNLGKPEKSDIKFEISKFPDGQQAITIKSFVNDDSIEIVSSITSFKDLELIICANQALLEAKAKTVSLYCPYFLGARSDRKFSDGSTNYLKTVIGPIINLQNFSEVTILDPHSDVLEACLNRFNKVDNLGLVKFALTDIDNTHLAREKMVVVSPDAGALKKIYTVVERFDIDKLVIAAKHRDIKSGKITHTEVPGLDKYSPNSNFVIIDDICDGGRTFIELAKTIRSHVWPRDEYFSGKIYLVVTHGIFTAGLLELNEVLDGIYCTNSVKEIEASSYSDHTVEEGFVKQLNVF